MLCSVICFKEENRAFTSTSTQILKDYVPASRALFLRYVVGGNQGYHIAMSDF